MRSVSVVAVRPLCGPVSFDQSLKSSSVFSLYRRLSVAQLTLILIVLQVLDGLLTGIGVGRMGLHAEGNPLIRELMMQFGAAPVLLIIKMTAIIIILTLAKKSREVQWIHGAMGMISCFYLAAAIAPWTYLLLVYPTAA